MMERKHAGQLISILDRMPDNAGPKKGLSNKVRRKSFSNKEKQIWLIREKRIKAKGNNRKKPSVIQRKNEN